VYCHKTRVSCFSTRCPKCFFSPTNIWRDTRIYEQWSSRKITLNLSDRNRNQNGYKTLRKIPEYQTLRKCVRRFSSCFMRTDRWPERTHAPRGVPNALKHVQSSNYGQRVTSEDSRCGITTLTRIWGTATGSPTSYHHQWYVTKYKLGFMNGTGPQHRISSKSVWYMRWKMRRPSQPAIRHSFYATELYSKLASQAFTVILCSKLFGLPSTTRL
jgi:hypothetical protein